MAYSEKFKTIIVANTAEAFSVPISYLNNPSQRNERIRIENVLSQRAVFWEGDDKVIITPVPVNPELLEIQKRSLGLNNILNISPEYTTYNLCQNIIEDKQFLEKLTELIHNNKGIQITAYSYTRELDNFVKMLIAKRLSFRIPEMPSSNPSIVGYLDSKSGFRKTAGSLNGVLLPEGYVCPDEGEVMARAMFFKRKNSPFIIKANEGESGWGLFFVKDPNAQTDISVTDGMRDEFRRDGIWASRPYVAEEYISLNKERGGGSPSTELYLTNNSIMIKYNSAQLFDKEGQFSGITMGKGVLDEDLQERMEKMSVKIGERYYSSGYRGFFDIDFAISRSNILYALETNMRRTGGTHVFDFARRIFGDKWKDSIFFSNDSFKYANQNLPLLIVLDRIGDILFPIEGRKEGLVLSLFDDQEPVLGYILVGDSLSRIRQFQSALLDYFNS